MKIDLCWLLIIIIFLLGVWRYFRCQNPRYNHRRQGLLLMVIAILLGVVYYYSNNTLTLKATMNGDELAHCRHDLHLCATKYAERITQANQLWEEHQQLRGRYDDLALQYQKAVGHAPDIQRDDIDDLATLMQARLFH